MLSCLEFVGDRPYCRCNTKIMRLPLFVLLLLASALTACSPGAEAKRHFKDNRDQYDLLIEKVIQDQPASIDQFDFDRSDPQDAVLKVFLDSFEEVRFDEGSNCLELAPVYPPLPVIVWCQDSENVKTTLAWSDRGNSTQDDLSRFTLEEDYYLIVRDWN